MKKSLLKITQDILNDLDCDEVNSIDDTVESQQVANIIRQCYYDLITTRNWAHTRKLITLDSSLDTGKPTYFKIPEAMKEMVFFNYDKAKVDEPSSYLPVKYLYPDKFLYFVSQRARQTENVQEVVDFSGVKFHIYNNTAPQYWTSFDDEYIVCDSYDKLVDSTLQSSKTQVLAYMIPQWDHVDDYVPDFPVEAFSLLTEEAKSTAAEVVKQTVLQKAEQKSQKNNRWLSRKDWSTHGGVRYQNYGRRSSK